MESSQPSAHYTASATNFSFSLYSELSTSVEGNLFASTFSVHLLLLLLTMGSKSKTNDDLLRVLHLPKNKPTNYERLKTVIENIEHPKILTVANGVFPDSKFDLNPNYENQARDYLKSEVKKINFSGNSSGAESEINEWAKSKTNGKISKLFDSGSIDDSTLMVLASAVHFQNTWENEFRETKNETFCVNKEKHVDIQMMHITEHYRYYKDEQNKFAALEIPYQHGGFEMLVILPDKMDGLNDLEKTFLSDSTKFPLLLNNLTIHEVVLSLPKFKFESDINLQDTMAKLGCGDMFLPGADFSEISSSGAKNLRVDKMKHKSIVDVNEIGTEAAGITAVSVTTYSFPYYPPETKTVNFRACHPFLFIIKKGSDIVFMGRFSNPNA